MAFLADIRNICHAFNAPAILCYHNRIYSAEKQFGHLKSHNDKLKCVQMNKLR